MPDAAGRALLGAAAGCVATGPMTLVMDAFHAGVSANVPDPLPPRRITMEVADAIGIEDELAEPAKKGLTLAGHYGYGAATGAIYGALAPHLPVSPVASGVAFGLAVWAGSYLGLLPAAGLMPSATKQKASRNALMIGAHIVWGATLGLLMECFGECEDESHA